MPKYSYKLTNGKTLDLEGDTPPSDDEVETIAKQHGVELLPATAPPDTVIPDKSTSKTTSVPFSNPQGDTRYYPYGPYTREPKTMLDRFLNSISTDPQRDPNVEHPSFADAQGLLPKLEHPKNEGWTGYLARGAYNQLVQPLSTPLGLMGMSSMGLNPSEIPTSIAGKFLPNKGMGKFPTLPGQVKVAGDEAATGAGAVYDKFAKYRATPVGTKFVISPTDWKKVQLNAVQARQLGFDFFGLDDKGKLIIKKIRESPAVEELVSPEFKQSTLEAITNLPRATMSGLDASAPLRQGLGLIHRAEFWKSLPSMFKAMGSEEAYQKLNESILSSPIFKKRVLANGKLAPSIAEEAGLSLTNMLNNREESIMSNLPEAIPILGHGYKASNRAYTAFLNKLRADTFEQMAMDFGAYSGINVKNDIPVLKNIAEFVNSATGRGSLNIKIPFGPNIAAFEQPGAAKVLSSMFFSPRLIASRLKMMSRGAGAVFSPETYMLSAPSVRREYLKSLFAIAGAANTFTQLMKMGGAEVESDMASSDFGKAKVGDTRIDPYGGFQQYIVAAQRLMPEIDLSTKGLQEFSDQFGGGRPNFGAQMKSTTTGQEYSLWDPQFGQSSQADVALRFIRSKLNPILNFVWGLLDKRQELSGRKMQFGYNPEQSIAENFGENSIVQRLAPMVAQDIYDLITKGQDVPNSMKAIAATGAFFGMGSQTYGREY